jgi:NTP pyrophosphatase (non-canonical NTP hydrolase)
MNNSGVLITLNEYQSIAQRTDQNKQSGLDGLAFPLLGLFGEVGTLLSALKKKQRDRESFVGYTDAVIEEFGDVLWYFSNITSRASLSLSMLAQRIFRDLQDWDDVKNDFIGTFIPNHKREATDRASSIESLPTREAMTDLVISERRFLTKSLNSSIFLGKVNRKPCFKCNQTRSIGFNSGE